MFYHVLLRSYYPCDLALIFSSLSLTIQIEKSFFKWWIITLSRLSTLNQHMASHQSVINQVYRIRRNILQDVNYKFTESRKSKLGEIWFSVVWFCLVHSIVQVTIWGWSKSWRGWISTKGICIGLSDIAALLGQ